MTPGIPMMGGALDRGVRGFAFAAIDRQMILVFFVYGLAFFAMGFAIALESRRSSGLGLAVSLPYLAAFGILHSLVEWVDMWLLIESAKPPTFNLETVRLARTILLGISTVALIQFGASLLSRRTENSESRTQDPGLGTESRFSVLRRRLLSHLVRYLPYGLGFAWLATLMLLLLAYPLGTRQWLIHADIWARYLLYLPGSLLAGFGLISQANLLERTDFRQIARDARFAAATFLINAMVAGLVVPPGQNLPAVVVNYETFLSLFGFPVQILRAVSALAIAYFVLRVLRVFSIESSRQMKLANQRQIQAQQEALEAQRRAQAEMERWNRELENRIGQRTAEISLRNKQLLAVNSIAASISQSFDLKDILSQTLQKTLEALDADGGGIFLSSEVGDQPTTRLAQGLPEDFVSTISKTRMDTVMVGELASPREMRSVLDGPFHDDEAHQSSSLRSFLTAPLKSKGCVVGVMCVARRREPGFGQEDGRLLTAIGHQVGVAVENVRLFSQVQNMAALEERERLAREMHDGLAQVMGFLGIKTKVVQQFVASGKNEQAMTGLAQMHKTVHDAYADIRQTILSLRTATELDRGLVAAIRESASDFTEQNSIPVELALEENGHIYFPPEAEVQLVRIVQEALANVRKHAEANRVWIRLERHDGEALLTVEDDGIGFNISQMDGKKRRCFGLETMRERAESIGADLDVIPVPGEGTRIKVRYPLDRFATRPNQAAQNPVS